MRHCSPVIVRYCHSYIYLLPLKSFVFCFDNPPNQTQTLLVCQIFNNTQRFGIFNLLDPKKIRNISLLKTSKEELKAFHETYQKNIERDFVKLFRVFVISHSWIEQARSCYVLRRAYVSRQSTKLRRCLIVYLERRLLSMTY